MIGLISVIVCSIIISVILIVPVFRLMFGRRKRRMGTLVLITTLCLILFSYMAKSFFTVFMSILPFLVVTSFLGAYMSVRRIRRSTVEKGLEKTFNLLIVLFFILYFFVMIFGKAWIGVPFSGLRDAELTEMIDYSTDFNNLRLVPPALAEALSKTKNTESDSHVGEKDFYYDPIEMRLKWVAVLEPDNVIIGLSRTSPGFIDGYAGGTLNPSVDFFEKELVYTEERPLIFNIYTQVWLNDPTYEYGNALLIKRNDEYLWLVPLMRNFYGIVMTYDGVATVNAGTGETVIYPKGNIPEWLGKWRVYPREVASWRVAVYSMFKHGVINAFVFKKDIDEIPYGTEPYLINIEDEVYWFVSVEPAGGQEKSALSGYYLIGANGNNAGKSIFVDKKQKNFIGPTIANNYVDAKISNYDGWKAMQPLLYPYKSKETWVVPILYTRGEFAGMKLVAVGFVDADTEKVTIRKAEDETAGTDAELPASEDDLIAEYRKYRDEISDILDKMDDVVDALKERS
ncbi:MAG: hypothetical protein U9Q92_03805 [archaeon]|nr:hypothetical protein [archaeon]